MLYFGVVENILDPQDVGRVQVRIYPYYQDFAVKDLPWAYVLRSTDFGTTFGRALNQHNLVKGSQVLVEFLDTNLQQPIVLGIVPRETDFEDKQSFDRHTICFKNGGELTIDETEGNAHIEIKDVNENKIILKDGEITIDAGTKNRINVITRDGNIYLGDVPDQPAVLGTDLTMYLNNIISAYNSHTHMGNLGFPTTTPITPIEPTNVVSEKVLLK